MSAQKRQKRCQEESNTPKTFAAHEFDHTFVLAGAYRLTEFCRTYLRAEAIPIAEIQ